LPADQAVEIAIAERVASMVADYGEVLAQATEPERGVILRALAVVASYGDDLPDELARDIEAISVLGVDPAWQIGELRKILDRWAPRQ
jgi:hypothetical protein